MSSSRAIVKTFQMIGGTQGVSGSMAASITSAATILDKIDQVAIQIAWTSSDAVGTIAVQGSVDGLQWDDVPFSPALPQPSSNNNSYMIALAEIPFMYIRVKYTRTSGTGTLSAKLSAKGN